ncbi:MAG: hypothetical protein QOG21_1159, partial [Actinomycetota bacterium]|nr:hypothetical protein [Actinomycetota bacterium]
MTREARVRRRSIGVLVVLVGLIVAAGVAYAAIPDSTGVYTACKLNAAGTIRLIDPSLPSTNVLGHCTSLETLITWNQKGLKGDPGANGANGSPGTPGADGKNGVSVT